MRRFLAFLFYCLAAAAAQAQPDSAAAPPPPARFHLHGYVKDLQTLGFGPEEGSLITGNLLHNRLNARYDFSSTLSARLELRTRLFWGEQVRLTPGFAGLADYETGLMDLSWTPVDQPAVVLHTIADRLSLNWRYRAWDVTLGRQRVNWGLTMAWNPNDLFNAFNFFDFDYEERPGSDALRVRYSPGGMSGFDLALARGQTAGSTIGALLYRFNRRGYDFQVLGAWYRDDLALGAGWAGSIGQAAFKGEATWFQPRRRFADTTGVLSLTLDGSYTFEDGWYVGGAFLYTGSGANDAQALDRLAVQTLSARMLMPFKYSLLLQGAKPFTPLFTAQLSVIYCPGPDALIVFPVLTCSLSDNWDLNLVVQSWFASTDEKFRNQGNTALLRLKWAF